jgi:hypothetical protein
MNDLGNDIPKDVTSMAPGAVGPRIPAPPPRDAIRRPGRGSWRGVIWLLALAAGAGGGVAAYQWAPMVDSTFDYWLSLALD